MDKYYFDTETLKTITETELKAVFDKLKSDDPETYDYSFKDYIRNCTDKNGVLIEITESMVRYEIDDVLTEMFAFYEIKSIKPNATKTLIDDCMDEIKARFKTFESCQLDDIRAIALNTIEIYKDLGLIEGF